MPAELAAAAVPAGLVSYVSLQPEGLKPDVLFVYDLELPADFVPSPQDGEVRSATRLLASALLHWLSGIQTCACMCCSSPPSP